VTGKQTTHTNREIARKSNIDFYITLIDSVDRVKFGYSPTVTKEGKEVHIRDAEVKIEYMTYISAERSTLNRRRKNAIKTRVASA
jgi:hypothetical protein